MYLSLVSHILYEKYDQSVMAKINLANMCKEFKTVPEYSQTSKYYLQF